MYQAEIKHHIGLHEFFQPHHSHRWLLKVYLATCLVNQCQIYHCSKKHPIQILHL